MFGQLDLNHKQRHHESLKNYMALLVDMHVDRIHIHNSGVCLHTSFESGANSESIHRWTHTREDWVRSLHDIMIPIRV